MAAAAPVSPLAPKTFAELPALDGVRLAAGAAGIRYKGRTDVLLAVFDEGATVAGVFTTSKCPSAPVDWCRENLSGGRARALVVNSGNANAFTGKAGREATELTAKLAAKAVGADENEIFLASTGVIGEPLDASKFEGVLDKLAAKAAPGGWLDAAKAIMTTDTFPESRDRQGENRRRGGHDQRHGQGRGHDRARHGDHAVLCLHRRRDLVGSAAEAALEGRRRSTFNAVTVDSDTSTSDTLMLFATGAAEERGQKKVKKAGDKTPEGFCRDSSTPCCSISPSRSRATAKARASSSRCR